MITKFSKCFVIQLHDAKNDTWVNRHPPCRKLSVTMTILMVPFSKSHTPKFKSNKELPERKFGVHKTVRMTIKFPTIHRKHITHSDKINITSQTF